ncbi:MAG: hypothetical protein HY791_30130 [Deltaproteobacteria bacterium]|nr:hypothetical protein [Deltaproteobacteria bacterium]
MKRFLERAAVALLLTLPVPATAATVAGALIMDGAKNVDTDRYRMAKDWDDTLRFYRRAYPSKDGYSWRFYADTPKVKIWHVANLKKKREWEGLNIYETPDGVFVFVLRVPAKGS